MSDFKALTDSSLKIYIKDDFKTCLFPKARNTLPKVKKKHTAKIIKDQSQFPQLTVLKATNKDSIKNLNH